MKLYICYISVITLRYISRFLSDGRDKTDIHCKIGCGGKLSSLAKAKEHDLKNLVWFYCHCGVRCRTKEMLDKHWKGIASLSDVRNYLSIPIYPIDISKKKSLNQNTCRSKIVILFQLVFSVTSWCRRSYPPIHSPSTITSSKNEDWT